MPGQRQRGGLLLLVLGKVFTALALLRQGPIRVTCSTATGGSSISSKSSKLLLSSEGCTAGQVCQSLRAQRPHTVQTAAVGASWGWMPVHSLSFTLQVHRGQAAAAAAGRWCRRSKPPQHRLQWRYVRGLLNSEGAYMLWRHLMPCCESAQQVSSGNLI